VETLLRDEEWGSKSDRWIAETAHVGHPYVAKVRSELESDSSYSKSKPRTGKDGKKRGQSQPRAKPDPEAPDEPPPAEDDSR
jgi:hypothetical protein